MSGDEEFDKTGKDTKRSGLLVTDEFKGTAETAIAAL